MPFALLVDDDAACTQALADLVQDEGFETETAATLEEAEQRLRHRTPDVVLLDLFLPDGSSMDLLSRVAPSVSGKVVLITGHASVETAVDALKLGACDYLSKPLDTVRLRRVLHSVLEDCRVQQQLLAGGDADGAPDLVSGSQAMMEVKNVVSRVAPTDATVFITGETGTGKELVAGRIHALSTRRDKPYIAVNCAALSPNLLESELFGHERGSFTGAARRHSGFFERANGGTMFLDEVSEMPLELQPKLLRVLEQGTFVRVGGDGEVKTDVRIIAASNRDPEAAVRDGKLRQDLLYRLRVFPVVLPPLRDRGDDVLLLAEHFLSVLNSINETTKAFTAECRAALKAHSWPGNVRELRNLVRRAFIMADSEVRPEHMFVSGPSAAPEDGLHVRLPLGGTLADAEKRLILATLEHCAGHRRRTADVLGISPKTLYNRLVEYGIS